MAAKRRIDDVLDGSYHIFVSQHNQVRNEGFPHVCRERAIIFEQKA